MNLLYAPLEGITYPEYRKVHHSFFPGDVEKYYAPFVAPGSGKLTPSWLKRRFPDFDIAVPQLMANDARKFLETANILADMGCMEINLNAGCPSGTVFSKHKGAGMLMDLNSLDAFLGGVFAATPVRISVKTRMGVEKTEEFAEILKIYNRYPIALLTVHARARSGYYKSTPDVEGYAAGAGISVNPVCYNGNIFSKADLDRLIETVPGTENVMCGRGLVANPALGRILKGGMELALNEFMEFNSILEEEYLSSGIGRDAVMKRMKELWYYEGCLFDGKEQREKKLLKSRNLDEFRQAFQALVNECPFNGAGAFNRPQ